MIMQFCRSNLQDIRSLLLQLSPDEYDVSLDILSGSSIGQHVRHILEFYLCLLRQKPSMVICYDHRKRNKHLQSDVRVALRTIDDIDRALMGISIDLPLLLQGNFGHQDEPALGIPSSFYRELVYCLEHSIHHQALIKIGLKELQKEQLVSPAFGVAPSTIRHSLIQAI